MSPEKPENDAAVSSASAAFRSARGLESNVITVLVGSGRESLLEQLLPRMASEQDIEVLSAPVADAAFLLMRLVQWRPKLLLLNRELFHQFSPKSLYMIHRMVPSLRVLLLAEEACPGLVEETLRCRFRGILLTSSPPDACLKAIRAVGRGDIWLPRCVLAKALSDLLQMPGHDDAGADSHPLCADSVDKLTQREKQLVRVLSQGLTNKEIARQLDIKEDTVKKHLQSVFGKLGVHRRTLVVLRQLAGQQEAAVSTGSESAEMLPTENDWG